MIIIILFAVLMAIGILMVWITEKTNNDYGVVNLLGMILTATGLLFLVGCIVVLILTHASAEETMYENQIKYDGLCRRLEVINSEYEDVSKSDVIADITEWNQLVYSTKYWSINPWTNWFYPKKIADNMEYIPLEKGDTK